MSLARIRMIQARLVDAIRRHGFLTVVKVIAAALLRYGFVATVRLGGAERPFPWRRGKSAPPSKPATQRGDPDLDDAFTLDPTAWDAWRRSFAGDERAHDSAGAPVPIVFVILGGDGEAAERTWAAVGAMGPGARVWSGEAPGADGLWVFLQAGDVPSPDLPLALARMVRAGAQVVSFDLWREVRGRVQPLLAPGANATLLRAVDYVFSRIAMAPALLPAEAAPDAISPRDLVLRWLDGRPAHEARSLWRHVGRPLVRVEMAEDAVEAARAAVFASRARPVPPVQAPASVVICTRDKGHLTRQLVGRLLDEAPDVVGEVVIVSNNTRNPYALAALADLGRSPRVQVLRINEPFNFSALCNAGVRQTRGQGPLLFLNDDIAPVSEDWLQRMAARLDEPSVGAVGPLLLYPDERVQHAGVYLGKGGGAGHIMRAARLPEDDYLFTACAAREVSALTAAALLTSRAAFEALNGFDEQLAIHLQDVDYCLRLQRIGLTNVFDPAAVLIHMESISIRQMVSDNTVQRLRSAELARFRERWGELIANDPFHPAGFDPDDETLRRLAGSGGLRSRWTGKSALTQAAALADRRGRPVG
jgi:GT2 family glycosyltransferase